MNKVVRFKGNTAFVPQEAGNLYIDGDKAVLIDQAGRKFVFASAGETQSAAESAENESMQLKSRVEYLEQQLKAMKTKNASQAASPSDFNQPENDVVVSVSEPVSGSNEIKGKAITVNELTAENGLVKLTATDDVDVSNLTTDGTLPKSTSNAQVIVNTTGFVTISDSTIAQNGYNAVEIGISNLPKSIYIQNVDFSGTFTNNIISIFGTEDNATVTISNCKFGKCSNPLRLSNRGGGKVTVNFMNCEFDQWDTGEYSGCVILQDYTSKSKDETQENNLFAPDKVSISFTNCTYKGEKIAFNDIASVAGTKQDSQLLYVYANKEGFILYDENRYPTVTAK